MRDAPKTRCLPSLSHSVIVNKTCLSLSLSFSLSLVESVGFVKSTDRTWKGKKKNKPTVCSKDSSFRPSISPSSTPSYSPPPPHHASPSSQSSPPLPRRSELLFKRLRCNVEQAPRLTAVSERGDAAGFGGGGRGCDEKRSRQGSARPLHSIP